MTRPSLSEIRDYLRAQVHELCETDFADTDDLVRDLHLDGDDLSDLVVAAEKRFGIRIKRSEYTHVNSIQTLASLFDQHLVYRELPPVLICNTGVPTVLRERERRNSIDIKFMAANAVGIGLYLLLASRGWRIPQEHEMVPMAGEPFVWALALPLLGAFLLANAAWAGLLWRRTAPQRWRWWLVTAAVWLIAVAIDFSRH